MKDIFFLPPITSPPPPPPPPFSLSFLSFNNLSPLSLLFPFFFSILSSLPTSSLLPSYSLPLIISLHFLPPFHSLSSSSGAALWPRLVSDQYLGAEHNPECLWGGLHHSPSGNFRGQGLHQTLFGLPEGGGTIYSLSVFQYVHSS